MTTYEGITLTPSLLPNNEPRAITVLHAYYARTTNPKDGYTGGQWDTFDPSRNREHSPNVFTPDDLVACSLLGTPIGGSACLQLLDPAAPFGALLTRIGPDQDFTSLHTLTGEPFGSVRDLYRALQDLPGVGGTRATKLLARKRPRLVPIVDSVIKEHIFGSGPSHWTPLHSALTADHHALWKRLLTLHQRAGLAEAVSGLRVFDVLAWMDGSGRSDRLLNSAVADQG